MTNQETVCLNGMWEFKCDIDAEWGTIRVPGCYTDAREMKWRKDYWDAYGYPRNWEEQGARYRRTLNLSAEQLSKPLAFRCDGCYHVYRVLLNGENVGGTGDGHTPYRCQLNGAAVEGENTLEIVVSGDKGKLSGGETTFSRGIWQDTFLVSHGEVFIDGNPSIDTRCSEGRITCRVPITNLDRQAKRCQVKAVITDREGNRVNAFETGLETLPAESGRTTVKMGMDWRDARLWFPHDPYLYTLQISLADENGTVLDRWEDRFGFREISYAGPHLYLNARELFLRGHGGHYLGDLQGTKAYHLTWMREFKKRGINFLRLHVYPKHRDLYRAADEVGMMLMGEPAFHFKVPEETEEDKTFAKEHLGRMIDHLRNHPSIIMWSVSNELRWRGGGEKPWLVDHGRKMDPTRPVFSSDFSAFSTKGDLLGHHYCTDTVFSEWEEHGPDKPMIWDECGSVWQEIRPLHNGSAGFEACSQDYATGMFRDGNDEILVALDLIRQGKTFSGELHRVNAVIPWDLGYVFFRWQPYNRFRGITCSYPTPVVEGTQPQHVLPCCSPLNIWDPTLPVYEPNPGFYLFEEDLKWVRFTGESKAYSFTSGASVAIETPLFLYDDLRRVDAVKCRVENREGLVLTETATALSLNPGARLRDVSWPFIIPEVSTATPVKIVRQFSFRGDPGYRDERYARVYPTFHSEHSFVLYDPENAFADVLKKAGAEFTQIDDLADAREQHVLLAVADELPPLLESRIASGLKVIQLQKGTGGGGAIRLMNGPDCRYLKGLPQEVLTHWRGGSVSGKLPRPAGTHNARMFLAGDRDGDSAALYEEYVGRGMKVVTSLRIAESFQDEPAAGWVLRTLLATVESLDLCRRQKVAICATRSARDFLRATGVVARMTDTLDDLEEFDVLLLEAARAKGQESVLRKFAEGGGSVVVFGLNEDSLACFRSIVDPRLTLVEPYLGERKHCVKAAVSWTLRSTPPDGVEYYDGVVIPQPFEPNYDSLLAGIANRDLNWPGKNVFDRGVTLEGLNPVGLDERATLLISNWRIDWSLPPAGGEYINVGKDIRRANWFLNRTPILLKIRTGKGLFLFNQMILDQDNSQSIQVCRQLLTNLGCSLGVSTSFPAEEDLFDLTRVNDQKQRLEVVEQQLRQLTPLAQIPPIFSEMQGAGGGTLPKVLLIMDDAMKPQGDLVNKYMKDFGPTSMAAVSFMNPVELAAGLQSSLGTSHWDIIYFTLGNEAVLNDERQAAIHETLEILQKTQAQLMWGSTPPEPTACAEGGDNDRIVKFNAFCKALMTDLSVYINDCYDFYDKQLPAYLKGDENMMGQEERQKVAASIAEAIKFFGN